MTATAALALILTFVVANFTAVVAFAPVVVAVTRRSAATVLLILVAAGTALTLNF